MSDETTNQLYSRRRLAQAVALGGVWTGMSAPASAAPVPGDTVFDVRKFGAKGDGKADDTKAIQSAIDAAANGGAVFVPPGVHLSSELQLRPHVGFVGIPAWAYSSSGGSVLRLIDPNAASLVNITGAMGATIDGLSLEGAGLGKNVHGVFLNKKEYEREDAFRIERSRIANFSGDGVRLQRAWCFTIRHSMMGHNGGDGVSLRGWDGFLMDNWLSGNRGAGFAAREENASCTLTGNRIEWNREGIIIAGGDSYNITGNFFDRSGTFGLEIIRSERGPSSLITVSGNVVRRSGKLADPEKHESGQMRLDGARGVVCCANSMQVGQDDNRQGVWSPSYGIVYKDLENCVISNNVLHGGAIRQLLVDQGGHGEGVVVKDNPGSIFQVPRS